MARTDKTISNNISVERALEAKDILDSATKELDFYRKRQLGIYYFSMLSQVMVLTGHYAIMIPYQTVARIIYSSFHIILFYLTIHFSNSYVERIHFVRDKRAEIIDRNFEINPFAKHGDFKTASPNQLYILTIGCLAFLGVVAALLRP